MRVNCVLSVGTRFYIFVTAMAGTYMHAYIGIHLRTYIRILVQE